MEIDTRVIETTLSVLVSLTSLPSRKHVLQFRRCRADSVDATAFFLSACETWGARIVSRRIHGLS